MDSRVGFDTESVESPLECQLKTDSNAIRNRSGAHSITVIVYTLQGMQVSMVEVVKVSKVTDCFDSPILTIR